MLLLTLINETIPAQPMRDFVVERVPYIAWVDRYNYWMLVALFVPSVLLLLAKDYRAFVRFTIVGGILSLLRGICVLVVDVGPVASYWHHDPNAGQSMEWVWQNWWQLINPISALSTDAPQVALTKDMFFSGHVAATFLVYLYCRRLRKVAWFALIAHCLVVVMVLVSHLHYTMDIIGGWGISALLYWVCEPRLQKRI